MHAHFHVSIEQTDIRAEAGEGKTYNSFIVQTAIESCTHDFRKTNMHAYCQIYEIKISMFKITKSKEKKKIYIFSISVSESITYPICSKTL